VLQIKLYECYVVLHVKVIRAQFSNLAFCFELNFIGSKYTFIIIQVKSLELKITKLHFAKWVVQRT